MSMRSGTRPLTARKGLPYQGTTATPALTISGCALTCAPSQAAACRPNASAWPTHATLGARGIQRAAVGQAEARMAAPATATAPTMIGLLPPPDLLLATFRCPGA